MRTVLTLALAALRCAAEPAKTPAKSDAPKPPEFTIDDWSFTWTVAKVGDARLDVIKTPAATSIGLWSRWGSSGRLAPAQAEAVGAVLAQTETHAAKMRDSKKERTRAGFSAGPCPSTSRVHRLAGRFAVWARVGACGLSKLYRASG